jgi:hypothetical protein
MQLNRICVLTVLLLGTATSAQGFFIDGSGHYGLRGETRTAPGFSKRAGTYQAIEQTFRLTGEARLNDRSSAFLELRLFPDEREAYLGDTPQPRECNSRINEDGEEEASCEGRHQNTGEPGYKDYQPRIKKAYIQYAFDYCIVQAGRRGRDWGTGIFLDSGEDPFETDASVFDGIDCNINITKSQTLGFSIGYDKLAESGTYIDDPRDNPDGTSDADALNARDRNFGSNDTGDDIDQYFFTIQFDDRKANAGAAFTKKIGVYFSQISAKSKKDGGSDTDLKFLDLYTGFFLTDIMFENELLFRMGKSADPNWISMGGAGSDGEEQPTNKLQSIGLAGALEWTMASSGATLGPAEYGRGDASRHLLRLEYAYAPGDKEGYFGPPEDGVIPVNNDYKIENDNSGEDEHPLNVGNRPNAANGRDSKAEAMAFHRNFKPALIFFNARPEQDDLRQDGVFNPSRVMNASLFGFSYKYESIEGGNFESKIITGSLNETMPDNVKQFYALKKDAGTNADGTIAEADSGKRPPGYFGLDLGYELDLIYSYKTGRESIMGISAAYALPGKAWKTLEGEAPSANILIQTQIAFMF